MSGLAAADRLVLLAVLWIAWCALHSALIGLRFTRMLERRRPAAARWHRLLYNVFSAVTLAGVLAYLYSLPRDPVFRWHGWLRLPQAALLAGAVWLLAAGARHYDLRQFLGLRQLARRRPGHGLTARGGLDTSGILGRVRHPWYAGSLLLIWGRDLSAADLATNLVLSAYLVVGARLEERKLLAEFGQEYRDYMRRVPMLVPRPWSRPPRSDLDSAPAALLGGVADAPAARIPDPGRAIPAPADAACDRAAAVGRSVMSTELHELMSRHAQDLSGTVARRLHESLAPHYKDMDPQRLEERAGKLVAALLASLTGSPAEFVGYVGGIAEERIDEGYRLREIQSALNILEERAWRLVVDDAPAAEQVALLSRVTGTIGAAKDHLAEIYLEHKERAESRAARLQAKIDEMFGGTEDGPLDEDDL